MPDQEVVIVGDDGTEHVFPAGFDPKRAAAIVRGQATPPPSGGAMNFAIVNGVKVPLEGIPEDVQQELLSHTQQGDTLLENLKSMGHLAAGAVRGAVSSAQTLAKPIRGAAGMEPATPPPEETTTAGRIGRGIEQIGEFFLPSGAAKSVAVKAATKLAPAFTNAPRIVQGMAQIAPRMATEAAANAAVAGVQGSDVSSAAKWGAAGPLVGAAVHRGLEWAGSFAEPLARAAIKPTVAAMKSIAGASVTGINAQAERLIRFIIDNRITTPAKALNIITDAEQSLSRILALKNPPTDAPQRAIRYLQALEQSATKQALPVQDVATIRNAMAEVLETGLGEDVITMVPQPHPTLVQPNGQPITVLVPKVTRQLRTDVTAQEALERARATGKWETRKAYGEQKGAVTESAKAVERAARDAMKTAVPEARPILLREGQAIEAKKVMDRMAFRQSNRDIVGLPAHVMAAGEIASGHVPVLAFASNWLRSNQLKLGIWADRLDKAIKRNDVAEVTTILNRFGVGVRAATR